MKIATLKASNFLGIRHADLALRELNFFAGLNGSGKSSLENAIRLAFAGELSRIELKKEIGKLVHEGQKVAQIVIDGDPGADISITDSGSAKGIPNPENVPWWAHALCDQTYMAGLEPTALRRVLFEMSGGTSKPEIVKRLIQGGGDAKLVEQLSALLGNFEAAEKESGSQATQARGEWKGITGETYGEVKAETWKAARVEVPPKPDSDEQALLERVEELRQRTADARAALAQRDSIEKGLAQARELAELVERRDIAVKAALNLVNETKAVIVDLEGKASGRTMPTPVATLPCPECGSVLHVIEDGLASQLMSKEAYDEANKAKPDPKAKLKLAEQQKALAMLENSHKNAMRDHGEALKAAAREASLSEQLEALPSPSGTATLDAALAKAINARETAMTDWKRYTEAANAAKLVAERTSKAADAHARAAAWTKLKELLSPNGVPAQFLDGVLTKMNDRMRASADRTKWLQPQIHADMSITLGGRPYGLCSESERWKCDAFLTEAVGFLTAECFLMLDRVDVLHPDARGTLLEWFDKLATEGTQVLAFATLKAKPEISGYNVVWLEKGEAK